MSCCLKLKILCASTIALCLVIMGCGKKAETKDAGIPDQVRPPQTAIEAYLQKQGVSCENSQACPNYINKIVVVDGGNFRFCTGFLTEDDVVATSASCLPNLLRLAGQNCSRDVFFFFPKTLNRPSERVGCDQVLLSSDLQGQDPILWRDDIAFLRLEKRVSYRRQAQISRDGILNKNRYISWMIDQQDDYTAIVRKMNCEGIHNNYVNPLVQNESSPNMMVADCTPTKGGTGAPIIDGSRVHGVVSLGMDPGLRKYLESTGLLNNGLKEMTHVTNFACAPTPTDSDQQDERECARELSYSRVDRLRGEMLSTNLLFGDLKKKYEESLADVSKYVKFGVKLIPQGDLQETVIYPKCFRPLASWLETLSGTRNTYVDTHPLPTRSFRRVMDQYARIQGQVIDGSKKETFIQFSLKNLRAVQRSSILMWYKNEDVTTFQSITEECSSSLP